jgi:hypothetical protein
LRHSAPAANRAAASIITGFGDIVVLVNPAVEASAFQRLHVLSQGLNYDSRQTPIMLTLSADNDSPRHTLFTLGRILGEWFTRKPRKKDPAERWMERKALGVYGDRGEQVTHRLRPVDDKRKLVSRTISRQAEEFCGRKLCRCTWYEWKDDADGIADEPDSLPWNTSVASYPQVENLVPGLLAHDFSGRTVFRGVVLEPVRRAIPYQPMIVASAHPAVIYGHNGLFTTPFIEFLIRYVGLIEAKGFVLAQYRSASQTG